MTTFFGAVPGYLAQVKIGVINTLTLASEKFSKTPLCQRTAGIAYPYFKTVASYCWPKPLQFKIFSKETAGGAALAILFRYIINKVRN